MRRRSDNVFILAIAMAVCALASSSNHAPAQQPAEPAPQEEPPEEASQSQDPLPDLDELLGLPSEDRPRDDAAPAIDPQELELERALDAANVSEMFRQAIQQMSDAARLLREARDPGLPTQRVQEEILLKLDKLIEEAEEQQSSSSSSSSSQQQQQQQGQQRPQPSQPQESDEAGQGDNRGERTPPPAQRESLTGRIDAMTAAWGALPQRVRDALLQGAGDTYSSLYESMTEAYYRKLAEQDREQR